MDDTSVRSLAHCRVSGRHNGKGQVRMIGACVLARSTGCQTEGGRPEVAELKLQTLGGRPRVPDVGWQIWGCRPEVADLG